MAASAHHQRIGPGSYLRDQEGSHELGEPPLRIGERVFWLGEDDPEPGEVKWIGLLPDVCDEWTAGVHLDNEVGGMNGTWGGRVLFTCPRNHGIVISVNGLIKESDFLGNAVDVVPNCNRHLPKAEHNLNHEEPNGTQQQQHLHNGVSVSAPAGRSSSFSERSISSPHAKIERQSSEESWGDALEDHAPVVVPGKRQQDGKRRGDGRVEASSRSKRESCESLPPVPPPRVTGSTTTTSAPVASRLAASCSWLKESSKSVEAKIKAARQIDDAGVAINELVDKTSGGRTMNGHSLKSTAVNPAVASVTKRVDFRGQRPTAMDGFVVIGGVRVATPLKLWPLEYELVAPELRMVRARLAGKPLPEDVALVNSSSTDVNSLAVKRLLKLLEVSIGEGQLEEAATYARDLAQLKIQCCVTQNRQPSNSGQASPVILNMFVEDKISHHGPIPIRVSPSINVGELKTKIFHEFEFPVQIQRWILGKKLAMDDSVPLSKFGIVSDGCPVFLYLISLDDVSIRSTDLVWDNSLTDQSRATQKSKRNHVSKNDDIRPTSRPSSRQDTHEWSCVRCKVRNNAGRGKCSGCGCERLADRQSPTAAAAAKCAELPDEETEAQRVEREATEKAALEAKELSRLQNWQQYLRLDDQDLIYNQTAFECSVCFGETPPGEGVQLRDCLHTFCCDCLRNAVFHSDQASVICPFRDDNYSCDSTLQEREIRALVPPDVFERHLQRSVVTAESQAPNSFHCKTPDCLGWCLIEEKVNEFLCPACRHVSCITCRVNHQSMNCRQYQDQLDVLARTDDEARKTKEAVESMLARGEAMNCPNCAVVIMKKWGCDWLACSICKSEICWVTKGPRWGPRGKGDTSAGCRCGVNGVKCHTQCNYCH